jgi:hypothetical protein
MTTKKESATSPPSTSRRSYKWVEIDGTHYCRECDHLQEQHGIHGCRAAVHHDNWKVFVTRMDTCRCQIRSQGARLAWVKPNCYHCLHLKPKRGGSRNQVTCALGFWPKEKVVSPATIRKTMNEKSFFSDVAGDCAEFDDMRSE